MLLPQLCNSLELLRVKQHKTVSPPVLGKPPVSYVPSIVIPTVSSPEVKEQKAVSPPPLAKIPKSYVPSVVIPPVSDSEGLDKKSNSDEEDRPNIRATSVPRPRAVMSSPVHNDTVIGNKNKIKAARPSPLQNRGSVQSRHAQCKPIPAQPTKGSPSTTGKPKEPIEKRADHGGHLGSATTISSRRRKITTNKPSSVRV
ncbi:hypothetical protein K2173_003739 [Erythroxylum novogranatense]|uniref:Uncharacterized protein n=1 Tax=Erythroxylum novogranatense TaxID=1862640 RepID=A0AAV8TAV6_9ROSI|nr:hypothetical protein K2173_003739 [Erythroxylum novogranatense]